MDSRNSNRHLISSRQQKICEQVQKEGQVFINELAKEFSVSIETIRRDINTLSEEGLLRKVYGGAIPICSNSQEASYLQRLGVDLAEREKIGAYAAQFIQDNDVIALDNGVTIDCLAKSIAGVKNLTVILNSITALQILSEKQMSGDFSGEIIFLGGRVNCENRHTVGSIPNMLLNRFSVDKAFLSATAVSAEGVRMHDAEEGIYTSLLLKQAMRGYLLASSRKFGKEALYRVCSFDEIPHIITDNSHPIPSLVQKNMKKDGVNLHIVEV